MIEGIKISISGKELQELCFKRCHYHEERAEVYRKQIESFEKQTIPTANYSQGDHVRELIQRQHQHTNDALELHFIARHLVVDETYQLSREDLVKLGICSNPWD